MHARAALLASSLLVGLLTAGTAAAWLAEFGIEGMRVVSTAASEVRASVSPDGQRIVWGSTDRQGGAGGLPPVVIRTQKAGHGQLPA